MTTTTVKGFAGRLRISQPQSVGSDNLRRVGLRHFPRRTLGVYRARLTK